MPTADVIPLVFFLRRALGRAEAALDAGGSAEDARAAIDDETEIGLREVLGWRDLTVALGLMQVANGLDALTGRFDPILARGVKALEDEVRAKETANSVAEKAGAWRLNLVTMLPTLFADARVWRGIATALLIVLGGVGYGECRPEAASVIDAVLSDDQTQVSTPPPAPAPPPAVTDTPEPSP